MYSGLDARLNARLNAGLDVRPDALLNALYSSETSFGTPQYCGNNRARKSSIRHVGYINSIIRNFFRRIPYILGVLVKRLPACPFASSGGLSRHVSEIDTVRTGMPVQVL